MSLVLLQTCGSVVEAKYLQAMLQAEGIDTFVEGEHHRAQLGFLGTYVDLRLMVVAADLDDARELIEEADHAEHLPSEGGPPSMDDASVQRWREGAGDEPEGADELAVPGPAPRRAVLVPAFLGFVVGFGTGSAYARQRGTALLLFVAQVFVLGPALLGQSWALAVSILLRVGDAVLGVRAVRDCNATRADPHGADGTHPRHARALDR